MGVDREKGCFRGPLYVTRNQAAMKNLILIFAIATSFTTATFASNIGDGTLAIVKSEKVEITLDNEGQKEFILSSAFEADNNQIAMVFSSNVSMIQVFNQDGEVEMMFPVGSEIVNLGMSLFETGDYKVGFMVDGYSDVQYTNMMIK